MKYIISIFLEFPCFPGPDRNFADIGVPHQPQNLHQFFYFKGKFVQPLEYMVKICMICISSIESNVYNKKKIQMFGVNMTFISSEVKKCIFHECLSTEVKKCIFHECQRHS